jgi:DNA-binding NtrC family response regulator
VYKPPANEYQRAVESFKRELLTQVLAAQGGNRSRAARALGLQRTYFVRLIRDFGLADRMPATGVPRSLSQAR